ncbi:MAG: tRNA adenosine(34) deaminase TadA [Tissierellia bacterium]|jgi:tRNA(adenine34) deaminase|nr:tRNA adenosine(34) deaminase TadA [Tissierellia bacterium]
MDEYYMNEAIKQACVCTYEVPVGAVIVYEDKIIGRGYNLIETTNDPTTHAEIIAIRQASNYLDSWRLVDCTMYVTLEPCAMCAGAIVNSRIKRLVIGALDDKRGCCGSVEDLVRHPRFNHRVDLTIGVLEDQCSKLLKDFFKELRENKDAKL